MIASRAWQHLIAVVEKVEVVAVLGAAGERESPRRGRAHTCRPPVAPPLRPKMTAPHCQNEHDRFGTKPISAPLRVAALPLPGITRGSSRRTAAALSFPSAIATWSWRPPTPFTTRAHAFVSSNDPGEPKRHSRRHVDRSLTSTPPGEQQQPPPVCAAFAALPTRPPRPLGSASALPKGSAEPHLAKFVNVFTEPPFGRRVACSACSRKEESRSALMTTDQSPLLDSREGGGFVPDARIRRLIRTKRLNLDKKKMSLLTRTLRSLFRLSRTCTAQLAFLSPHHRR